MALLETELKMNRSNDLEPKLFLTTAEGGVHVGAKWNRKLHKTIQLKIHPFPNTPRVTEKMLEERPFLVFETAWRKLWPGVSDEKLVNEWTHLVQIARRSYWLNENFLFYSIPLCGTLAEDLEQMDLV